MEKDMGWVIIYNASGGLGSWVVNGGGGIRGDYSSQDYMHLMKHH